MKKITFILLLFLPFCLLAQETSKYQKIFKALKTESNSFTKVDMMNDAAQMIWSSGRSSGMDSIRFFAQSAEQLARKLKYTMGLAEALYISGKYHLAVTNGFAKSTPYFLESLLLYEELNDKEGISKCHLQLGVTSYMLEYYEDAVRNFQKSLEFNDNPTTRYMLAVSYSAIDSFEVAKHLFAESLNTFKKLGSKERVDECHMYLGKMYGKMNKADSAFYYLNLAINSIKTQKEAALLVRPYAFLGELYLKQNDIEKAIYYAEYSYNLTHDDASKTSLVEAATTLSIAYAQKRNYPKAYYYTDVLNKLRDSTFKGSMKQKVADMQSKFDFKKRITDQELLAAKEKELAQKEMQKERIVRNALIGGAVLLLLVSVLLFNRYNFKQKAVLALREKNHIILDEKARSDKLLLNILPEEVAEELKSKGKAEAKSFESVTVMFTDFKDFTKITEELTPTELVAEIDHCFKAFDEITSRHNIEKIKTIGDAYMCVGGLPVKNDSHATDIIKAAMEIQTFINNYAQQKVAEGKAPFAIRIGIHTGAVVAGIVGTQKFAYDIWGDTVNIASRMESSGVEGKINISGSTFEMVKDLCSTTYRGKVMAKNKGEVDMYFVEGFKL